MRVLSEVSFREKARKQCRVVDRAHKGNQKGWMYAPTTNSLYDLDLFLPLPWNSGSTSEK